MDNVRYGIVGIGNMGSGHFRTLGSGAIKGAVLTAACDNRPQRLEWAKQQFPGADIAYYEDYHDLLRSGRVDAVIIATPHYLHPVIAIDAFALGLNVLSEKPIGVYTKKVDEMYAAARASGKVFGIDYNQRTNPYYQKMREMVQGGELGALKRCVWIITDWYRTQAYYDSGTWRATWSGEGGGVLLNQCPHNLDLWQWIVGMPKSITAHCYFGKYHNIEVEDDVTAYAEYENGATAVFITTTGECPGTNRLEISGTKGKLVYENGVLTYTKLSCDEREYCFATADGFKQPDVTVTTLDCGKGSGPQHSGILQNYTNAILHGETLLAPGYDGINGLSLSNAMLLSQWKHKTVELPIDGDEYWEELRKHIATSRGKVNIAEKTVDLAGTYGTK
jgi:predicted dehydrogenase